ncbi:MAG: hypothetical protein ABI369_13755 [Acetobacteraceae bacterium]
MLRRARLQDRISWASNICARAAGDWADGYRQSGASDPLAPVNRFIRIPALFTGLQGKFVRPLGYGDALAHGIFDYAYTRPGDYLVQGATIWFIAAQQPLLPALCVRTDRVISFTRPIAPGVTGINGYGGVTATGVVALLVNWPASVIGSSGSGQPSANLPSDAGVPYWTVLLPAPPDVLLLPGDLLHDDLGRAAVVAAAELTGLGWRLTVKQAIT